MASEDPPTGDVFPVRVYYEDTDFSGVVYHASYLRFLERGRTEYLRACDIHQQVIAASMQPFAFAVRRMAIEFIKPAFMDDFLSIETIPGRIGGASIQMQQRISRGEEVILTADMMVACIVDGRAGRIPKWVRDKLAR